MTHSPNPEPGFFHVPQDQGSQRRLKPWGSETLVHCPRPEDNANRNPCGEIAVQWIDSCKLGELTTMKQCKQQPGKSVAGALPFMVNVPAYLGSDTLTFFDPPPLRIEVNGPKRPAIFDQKLQSVRRHHIYHVP